MTAASADLPSAHAPAGPSSSLRLRRGWLAGCTDHNRLTFRPRQRGRECCRKAERIWLLTDGEITLAALFDLATAQRIRDIANRCADFLKVDELCARVCEEHPSSVEVGLFHGEEFVHLIELKTELALDLLLSLIESLETVMKESASSADLFAQPDRPLLGRLTSRMLRLWRTSDASITMHPLVQELRRLAPLRLTLELLFRDECFGRSPEAFMTNLLVDVRHFCDAYQLDLGAVDHRAHGDYLEERHGAATRRHPAAPTPPAALTVPSVQWKDISEQQDESVLLTTVLIDGVSHHLKAIQVQMRNALQSAVDPKAEEELTDVHAASGASGPFETVRLEGREYVMTLTPHSR